MAGASLPRRAPEYLERADAILVRLSLLLLLVVAFLPYPTRLTAEFIQSRQVERVADTLYGLTLLAATALLSLWETGGSCRN